MTTTFDYDSYMLHDVSLKIEIIDIIKKYINKEKFNLNFNVNSLDLSYSVDFLEKLDGLFIDIFISNEDLVTEEIAEKLGVSLDYTDEDLETIWDDSSIIKYVKISSKYIDEFLKIMKKHNIPISILYSVSNKFDFNITYEDFGRYLSVLLSKGYGGIYIINNEGYDNSWLIDILKNIIETNIYCKKVVNNYYSGKEVVIEDYSTNSHPVYYYNNKVNIFINHLKTRYEFKIRCKPKSKKKKYTKVKIISKPLRFRRKIIKEISNKENYKYFKGLYKTFICRREYFEENGYKWCKRIKNIN